MTDGLVRISVTAWLSVLWPWLLAAFACAFGWALRAHFESASEGGFVFSCDKCGLELGCELNDGLQLVRPGAVLAAETSAPDLCAGCAAPTELRNA